MPSSISSLDCAYRQVIGPTPVQGILLLFTHKILNFGLFSVSAFSVFQDIMARSRINRPMEIKALIVRKFKSMILMQFFCHILRTKHKKMLKL
ncbi:hypothetical protein, partial [Cecembia lonarensis]|uniref:hypothetical protein n=1 Tax=Cecembia lonarensis TaxID=645110 RepID=UPI001EE63E86